MRFKYRTAEGARAREGQRKDIKIYKYTVGTTEKLCGDNNNCDWSA